MSKTDATTAGSNTGTNLRDAEAGGLPLKVCKYKDYFTSCLPTPQKGNAVALPMNGNAAIKPYDMETDKELGWQGTDNKHPVSDFQFSTPEEGEILNYTKDFIGTTRGTSGGAKIVALRADVSNVTAATINELRQAIAVQHILERDARTGTRYKEYLQGACGVTSPDARLDRSEYIGGYRLPININRLS